MTDAEKKIVTVDGIEYPFDELSQASQEQILNLQFVDAQLQQLHNELAVADTARIGYTKALKKEFMP